MAGGIDRRGPAKPRVLILACSARKRPTRLLLPAIERYDERRFRVLRKFLRERAGETARVSLDVRIPVRGHSVTGVGLVLHAAVIYTAVLSGQTTDE